MSDQQQSTTQAFLISDQQPQQKSQTFVKKTAAQRELYESGNELAAYSQTRQKSAPRTLSSYDENDTPPAPAGA